MSAVSPRGEFDLLWRGVGERDLDRKSLGESPSSRARARPLPCWDEATAASTTPEFRSLDGTLVPERLFDSIGVVIVAVEKGNEEIADSFWCFPEQPPVL